MNALTARLELIQDLECARLNPAALDPWEAWKIFKGFLRRELEGGYDAANVQIALEPGGMCLLSLTRTLSERDESGDDVLIWSLSMDFVYPATTAVELEELDIWLIDYPTVEEFAAVVEGEPSFQLLMAARPSSTSVAT